MNTLKIYHSTQVAEPIEYDAGLTDIEQSNNIQESLCLLHGIANLITEHNFQINTSENLSLTEIAQQFVSGPPTITEAISLLLDNNKTTISTHFDPSHDSLANVFHALIVTTGQNIDITAIKSKMIAGEEQCLVTFKTGPKIQRWKFKQTGYYLAENFLIHLISFLSISAQGRFVIHKLQDEEITYTFIPEKLYQVLATVLEFNLPKKHQTKRNTPNTNNYESNKP